jgi:hypothetical protein
LPTVERLHGCTVAGNSGGINKQFISEPGEDADKRGSSGPSDDGATVQPEGEWGAI